MAGSTPRYSTLGQLLAERRHQLTEAGGRQGDEGGEEATREQ